MGVFLLAQKLNFLTVHSSNKYLLSIYYAQGTVLVTGEAAMNEIAKSLSSKILYSSRERQTRMYNHKIISDKSKPMKTIKLDNGMQKDWGRGYFRHVREGFSEEKPFELRPEGGEGPASRNSGCKGRNREVSIFRLEPSEPEERDDGGM